MAIVINHDLWHTIMDFYIREAWLLDDRKFHEWLTLFTEDTFYFMPQRRNMLRHDMDKEISAVGELAVFEEDYTRLSQRIARLDTGMAWSEMPPSRTRHSITNLLLEPGEKEDELKARTAFNIYRNRLEYNTDWYVGMREDTLRLVDGEWKIASRTIVLDQAVLTSKNISIFF
ncbi:MAG TPA: 3-phenylpropionate/cinnamic acid dioxygenase subunit beta [Dehalococcoidia bacterium]|nr:3-phenylpropionate/cinnamic acid dioxygenase subunit beta [Dehalococcoidia bacterium]